MVEATDKREHSAKREADDLTDYQTLNSLGGAGVAGEAKETSFAGSENSSTASNNGEPATEVKEARDYNDGADFIIVDNKGQTNA